MVNINVPISDELHKKIKLKALMEDKTLKDFVLDTIREETTLKKTKGGRK